ncbi:hypothetical protein ACFLTN_01295 [Chloroflexota bacterium]
MAKANQGRHFAYQVGEPALCMLMAYREYGIISRAFMLEEHGKIIDKIRSRSEPFTNTPEKELLFWESRIYVEMVERVCQLIEDFATLCYALSKDLSALPQNILSQKVLVSNQLNDLTNCAPWYTILRYPDLDTLGFSKEDKAFLQEHYKRNIRILCNFVKVLEGFRKLHWRFYIKHKHANPLIYGLTKVESAGEPTIAIPAVDNAKQPEKVKAILINYSMYKKQRKIANTIIMLMRDLLERTIMFIELNGKPIIESVSYYKMSTMAAQKIQSLIEEYNVNIRRNPIQLTLKTEIPGKIVRQFTEFYDTLDIGAFNN